MRDNVKHFLQLLTERLDPPEPVVEIGALQVEDQEAYADVRPFFAGRAYLGSDMRPGPGVDCLADAHRLPLRQGAAGTVLLLDTLEHLHSPLVAVEEACRAVRPGGIVIISSVMNFPIHSFPSDYWRFTPAVFDYLLQPLAARAVFSQGDAEFPHTVIGAGMRASDDESCARFRAAIAEVEAAWSEQMTGGPLLRYEPLFLAFAQRAAERALPELTRGRAIAQSFLCPNDGLSRIDVRMSTLGRYNFAHVLFRVYEEGGERREIAAYRYYAPHVLEGAWVPVPVAHQPASAGRRYVLTVESPDADEGQGPALLASNESVYPDGQLAIDGAPMEGSMAFQVHCHAADGAPLPRPASSDTAAAQARAAQRPPNEIEALLLRAEEQRWEQVRYLASVIGAGFDGVRAELKQLEDRIVELKRLQDEVYVQSADAAALTRAVRRFPLYSLWRRFFGKSAG